MKKYINLIICFFIIIPRIFAGTYHGTIEILVADDFLKKTSKYYYYLNTEYQKYELTINNNEQPSNLFTGQRVNVIGELSKSIFKGNPIIKVDKLTPIMTKSFKQSNSVQPLLVLMLNFIDKKVSSNLSIQQVTQDLYDDEDSVNHLFNRSSFSQFSFASDLNSDNQHDIYSIDMPLSALNECKTGFWAKQAITVAKNQGIDIQQYKHFMFILPSNVNCKWGGLAHVGCGKTCYSWIKWPSKQTYAHELGHNLGFRHAGTDWDNDDLNICEYCDHSGIMGNGGYSPITAPQRVFAKWYEPYPDLVKHISERATFKLRSIDLDAKDIKRGYQVAIIDNKQRKMPYYLSYRTSIPPYNLKENYNKRVSVHRFPGPGGKTVLVKSLSQEQSFIDPLEGMEVKVTYSTDTTARILVRYDLPCTYKDKPCAISQDKTLNQIPGKYNYLKVQVPKNQTLLTIKATSFDNSAPIKIRILHSKHPAFNQTCEFPTNQTYASCSVDKPYPGEYLIYIESEKQSHVKNIKVSIY